MATARINDAGASEAIIMPYATARDKARDPASIRRDG
jgi:hypothetical protein